MLFFQQIWYEPFIPVIVEDVEQRRPGHITRAMVVVASNPVLICRVRSVEDLGMLGYREKARSVWLFSSVDTLDCWVATAYFIYLLFDTFLLHQLFRLQELNMQVIVPKHSFWQDGAKAFLLTRRGWFDFDSIPLWYIYIYIYVGQRKRKKRGKNNGGQQFSSPRVSSNLFALATGFCFTFSIYTPINATTSSPSFLL